METSTTTNIQTNINQPMSFAKSFTVLITVTAILISGLAVFIDVQQHRILEARMINELKSTADLSFNHVGGTTQIQFYHARIDSDEYIVRVTPNLRIIDSYSLTQRPQAGEYFKENYNISW